MPRKSLAKYCRLLRPILTRKALKTTQKKITTRVRTRNIPLTASSRLMRLAATAGRSACRMVPAHTSPVRAKLPAMNSRARSGRWISFR